MVNASSANALLRLLFVLMLVAIVGLALYPNIRLPELTPSGRHTDFFYHTIGFLSLTASATLILERTLRVVVSIAALAITLELLQAFIPGRSVYLTDLAASLFGVLLGAVMTTLAMHLWRRWFDTPYQLEP